MGGRAINPAFVDWPSRTTSATSSQGSRPRAPLLSPRPLAASPVRPFGVAHHWTVFLTPVQSWIHIGRWVRSLCSVALAVSITHRPSFSHETKIQTAHIGSHVFSPARKLRGFRLITRRFYRPVIGLPYTLRLVSVVKVRPRRMSLDKNVSQTTKVRRGFKGDATT